LSISQEFGESLVNGGALRSAYSTAVFFVRNSGPWRVSPGFSRSRMYQRPDRMNVERWSAGRERASRSYWATRVWRQR